MSSAPGSPETQAGSCDMAIKAVLWRKGSFGVNSPQGAEFVGRILTLAGTTRRRGMDLLNWLTRAIQADLDGNPAPSLRPA